MVIHFTCNGKPVTVDVDGDMRVLDVLRDVLDLTGTKEGCGEGECGACTIILNGKTVNSCLLYAGKLQGAVVETIEGLSGDSAGLHPIQESFLEEGAVQCGFCTPGMVLSTKALLDRHPDPSIKEIETALSGNFCRCTGYGKIMKAVVSSAEKLRDSREDGHQSGTGLGVKRG